MILSNSNKSCNQSITFSLWITLMVKNEEERRLHGCMLDFYVPVSTYFWLLVYFSTNTGEMQWELGDLYREERISDGFSCLINAACQSCSAIGQRALLLNYPLLLALHSEYDSIMLTPINLTTYLVRKGRKKSCLLNSTHRSSVRWPSLVWL